jgi:hypothetical protein
MTLKVDQGFINELIELFSSSESVSRDQEVLENVSDCTGCRNTEVLFYLTEILWDYKFLSDVTGCRKTQVIPQGHIFLVPLCEGLDCIRLSNFSVLIVPVACYYINVANHTKLDTYDFMECMKFQIFQGADTRDDIKS